MYHVSVFCVVVCQEGRKEDRRAHYNRGRRRRRVLRGPSVRPFFLLFRAHTERERE